MQSPGRARYVQVMSQWQIVSSRACSAGDRPEWPIHAVVQWRREHIADRCRRASSALCYEEPGMARAICLASSSSAHGRPRSSLRQKPRESSQQPKTRAVWSPSSAARLRAKMAPPLPRSPQLSPRQSAFLPPRPTAALRSLTPAFHLPSFASFFAALAFCSSAISFA